MKNILIILFCLFFLTSVSWAVDLNKIDRSQVVFKGGPTEQSEKLAMVWAEVLLYPKKVLTGNTLILSTRLTSRVKDVEVIFDFNNKNPIKLYSSDGILWEVEYQIPESVARGLHVARFKINGRMGSIERDLSFNVDKSDLEDLVNVSKEDEGYPLKVLSDSVVFIDARGNVISGAKVKKIKKDQVVKGLYKVPWYKVRLHDGREGWLISLNVEEPSDEFYKKGYQDYKDRKYSSAIKNYKTSLKIDDSFAKAWFWLSKCYWKIGQEADSLKSLQKALTLDPDNVDSILFSTQLAQNFYKNAHKYYNNKEYEKALKEYNKVLAIKPNSISTLSDVAKIYYYQGKLAQAQKIWKQVVKVDPENESALIALGVKEEGKLSIKSPNISQANIPKKKLEEVFIKPEKKQVNSNNYIANVQSYRTQKGTKVSDAIKSVIELTRSVGTLVKEDGWTSTLNDNLVLVKYVCLQDRTGSGNNYNHEEFVWSVDLANNLINPKNTNAQLLMNSW